MGDGQRLLQAANQLNRYVYRYAVPILVAPRNAPIGGIRSATGFFVRLPAGIFLVTAWHVVEHWIGRRGEPQPVLFQVGDHVAIEPDALIAWDDRASDVVFIRMTEQQARTVDVWVCEPFPRWPPVHPINGASVFMAGYPGQFRLHDGGRDVLFRNLSAHLVVEETRPNFVVCAFDGAAVFTAEDGTQIPIADIDIAGMSGGPVIFVGQWAYPIVALVSECMGPIIRLATLSHCDDPALTGTLPNVP